MRRISFLSDNCVAHECGTRASAARHRALRGGLCPPGRAILRDRKSTRLNSSHLVISYAVFCLKKNREQVVALLDTGEATLKRFYQEGHNIRLQPPNKSTETRFFEAYICKGHVIVPGALRSYN